MYCENCGSKLDNNANFCELCGTAVTPLGDPITYYELGCIYTDMSDFEKASLCYTNALSLEPNNENFLLSRGNNFIQMRLYSEAIKDYTTAIKVNNKFFLAYRCRAVAYALEKDFKKALADARKASNLGDPMAPQLLLHIKNSKRESEDPSIMI